MQGIRLAQLIPLVCGCVFGLLLLSQAVAETQTRDDLSAVDQQRVANVTQPATQFSKPEKFENKPAGAATTAWPANRHAFSQPQPNLSFEARERFSLGNALFRKLWVSSPATTQASDGLGPLYNARGCQSCHVKDGRGHLAVSGEQASSFVLQLGRQDAEQGVWFGDAHYGEQWQTVAVPGLRSEGSVDITYTQRVVTFDDGEEVVLREPNYSVQPSASIALEEGVSLSPRIAPSMIGMGLLEAIAVADILSLKDPHDDDEDGISGRASRIEMPDGSVRIGRFGLKAAKSGVLEQSAAAFFHDMGLSTSLHPQHAGEEQRLQLIWPYTDLLLHDMGEGLADGVGHNGGATGREWRTPPLWGLGLTQVVNPRATYLHDGRARTLMEAVLWHGGEAEEARDRVMSMSRMMQNTVSHLSILMVLCKAGLNYQRGDTTVYFIQQDMSWSPLPDGLVRLWRLLARLAFGRSDTFTACPVDISMGMACSVLMVSGFTLQKTITRMHAALSVSTMSLTTIGVWVNTIVMGLDLTISDCIRMGVAWWWLMEVSPLTPTSVEQNSTFPT